MPMLMSKDTMLGSGAETMDSSNSLATKLITGLLLFRLCILLMGGLFKAFTGAGSMLEVSATGLHRVATAVVHRPTASSYVLL